METGRSGRESKIDFKGSAVCGKRTAWFWKENKHDTTGKQTESR